jgi:hydroxyethylthiazole kinase
MKLTFQDLCNDLQKIRDNAPLVHNVTNFVVMNNTANALLAIGASPVMAHAAEEVAEMSALSSALVINIGTLSREWVDAMALAMTAAKDKGIPIIFDPVGIGATVFRTQSCLTLIDQISPTVIRGNASEIMALNGNSVQTKGVDSLAAASDAESAALALAQKYACVVTVSGAVDLITDGNNKFQVRNGNPMMPKVTGLGCTATALVGAFCAVNDNALAATTHAMTVMGICGEIAAGKSAGPGTLQVHLIDAFYNLTNEQIASHWLVDCRGQHETI